MKIDKRFGKEFGTELPVTTWKWTMLDLVTPGVIVVFILALGALIERYFFDAAFWLLALSGAGALFIVVSLLVILAASAADMPTDDGDYPLN